MPEKQDLNELHADLLAKFDQSYEMNWPDAQKQEECHRFARVPGAQWEGSLGEQFENRPRMEFNKVAKNIDRIISEYRNNRISVKFRPGDSRSNEDVADLKTGMFRTDLNNSGGMDAIDIAFEDAVTGGFGAFKITTEYEDEYDDANDRQKIIFEAIHDPAMSVWWDPNAKNYDKSDAKFCFIISSMTQEKFEDQWPDADFGSFNEVYKQTYFDWWQADVVYVAKAYLVETEAVTALTFQNPMTGESATYDESDIEEVIDELADLGFEQIATKKVKRKKIRCVVMGGGGILEDLGYISGAHIPVINVYGKRHWIDDIERVQGEVQNALDPQRLLNMQISTLAEDAGRGNESVPIVDVNQIKGLEYDWQNRHIDRPAFLALKGRQNKDGSYTPPTLLGETKPPQVSPALAALLDISNNAIQEVMGSPDNADQIASNISEKTMEMVHARTDMKTFFYIDNLAKSLRYAGKVWDSIAKEVHGYSKDYRVENEDGSDKIVNLMSVVTDTESGMPVVLNDITSGSYDVVSDVGASYQSKRQATVNTVSDILNSVLGSQSPQVSDYVPVLLGMLVQNIDGEGIEDLKDFNRQKMLIMGVTKPQTAEEEQMLASIRSQQQKQPDPNLIAAIAQQEMAEAEKATASVRQYDAETKRLKVGIEAEKIGADIRKLAAETESKQIENVQRAFGQL